MLKPGPCKKTACVHVQAGALAAARKELLEVQQKTKEVEEAARKLEAECSLLREQIASNNVEIDRQVNTRVVIVQLQLNLSRGKAVHAQNCPGMALNQLR